jgi:hypothetical protein
MAKRDAVPSQAVRLGEGGPHIDPRIQNPQVRAYAESARSRRAGPPKYTEPVNGGPSLPMPLLSGDPQGGATMAQQAALERGEQPRPQVRGGIVDTLPPDLGRGLLGGGGLLMSDLLPEEARRDPAFKEGVGAMYAQNQPELAKRYGVMRHGTKLAPQMVFGGPQGPGGQKGKLSPQTVQALDALNAANQAVSSAPPDTAPAPKETSKPLTEEEQKEVLSELDNFDFSKFRTILKKDVLNNDAQRTTVEGRLKPLDIVDLIVKGRVTQTVEIIPGKFEATYQSYVGEEDLQIKRWITGEIKTLEAPDRYFEDKYSLMGLTIALKAINKQQLPNCYNSEGDLEEELFWIKYKKVSHLDFHMLSSLHLNWLWFDARVRKLFVAEELGNG